MTCITVACCDMAGAAVADDGSVIAAGLLPLPDIEG
jgi:hypothetical protein